MRRLEPDQFGIEPVELFLQQELVLLEQIHLICCGEVVGEQDPISAEWQ